MATELLIIRMSNAADNRAKIIGFACDVANRQLLYGVCRS